MFTVADSYLQTFLEWVTNPDSDILRFALPMLAAINCWTVVCFWRDKARAVKGVRRIPESSLLWLALIGGTPGAFLARHIFRHKTRKEPFSTRLRFILILQISGLAAFHLL